MIYRGTTPTITLHINNADVIDFDNLINPRIAILNDSGRNKKIFTDCVKDNDKKTISTRLTYDDTMSFEPGYLLVQLAADLNNDSVVDTYRSPTLRMEIGENQEER